MKGREATHTADLQLLSDLSKCRLSDASMSFCELVPAERDGWEAAGCGTVRPRLSGT